MKFKGISTALAAFSLVAAPTIASAQPVSTPLTQAQPASETVSGDSELRGSSSGFLIFGVAIIVIALGIIVATRGNDRPNSP